MIQGSFIQQSIRDGSCVLYHDYRLGHAQDLSSYGNHGTFAGDIWLTSNGFVNRKLGSGRVLVAANAVLNISTFTIVYLCMPGRTTNKINTSSRICDKGGDFYIPYDDTTNQILLVTTATTRSWTFPVGQKFAGLKYCGLNAQHNVVTPCYLNGVFAVNINFAPSIVSTNVAFIIGNASGATRGFGNVMSSFMMFNRQLTATEHARLYGELMK
jgi:hypothetical protein